jgi:hypothetical protein
MLDFKKDKQMNVQTTRAFSEGHGVKLMIYGESGVGKTRSAKSLKDAGFKVVIVSAESGLRSLKGEDIAMIDMTRDDSGKELDEAGRISRLKEIFLWLKKGEHDFDTVFLDSLTEVSQAIVAGLKKKYTDAKDTLTVYRVHSEMMIELVKSFRDLPYNVVLVGLSETEQDPIGRKFQTVSVVGKVSQHLPGLMDTVLHLQIVEDEKTKQPTAKFQTFKTSACVAKDRDGALLPWEAYDLGLVFKKLKEVK